MEGYEIDTAHSYSNTVVFAGMGARGGDERYKLYFRVSIIGE